MPNSVSAGQTSTLTIVFLNPNAAAATGTALTDSLPANVVVANPANPATTCGGTVTATPGAGSVSISGATIPAAVGNTSGQCQFSVGVLSNTPGTYINTIPAGAAASSQGSNTQAAQATLVATALVNLTGTKTFAPSTVRGGGSASTMTITLTNSNGIALTNVGFTDSFPANLALNTPPNLATTCAGGTVTGVAGGTSVQLSGATVPASGSCTMTGSVITPNPNTAVNATRTNSLAAGSVTSAQGVTNSAISGNVTVQSGAAVTKVFAPTTITSAGTSSLTITVSNFNATALSGITFTDTFPSVPNGSMVVANPPTASTTCTGGTLTAVAGAGSVSLSGASLAAGASGAATCTVKVNVVATNTSAAALVLTNTNAAGTFGTVNYTGGQATLTVNPASPITGSKTYSPTPVQSTTTTATVTLTNNTAAAATITSFTDNLTTIGAGYKVGAAPAPGGTCGATITAPVGGTLVTATGGTIPASGSCTITFPIAIAITATAGTNTIAANAVQTTQGNNTLAITGPIDVGRAFTSAKAFAPATVQMGSTAVATITFTHNASAVPLSNLSFTDTLPAGHTVASPANASTTCGGTLTANPGASSFSLAGGALAAGATSCTVTVSIQTPASAGSATNSIAAGAVTTAEGATNVAFSATLTRVNTSVTINKSFTPATVAVGGQSQIAIQIRNNNANAIQLTNVALNDTLPLGMTAGTPPNLAFTGSGCSFTTLGIGSAFTLTGGTINANSICTLSANVKATAAGNLINNLPIGLITDAQGVTNPQPAAATLASSGSAFLTISKTDGVTTVTPGGTTTYTVSVGNTGPNDVAGLGVNDAPPAGVTFTSWTCAATPGSQCTASGSGAIADVVTLLNGGSLVYTVNAAIASNASGSVTNTASLGVPGTVIDTNAASTASDTDTVAPITSLAITKDDGVTTYTPGLTGTYTVVVTNGGPSDALNVTVGDTLPAGATLNGTVTCVAVNGAACGSVTGTAGMTSFGTTGAVVPAGGGARLTFTVPVAFGAGMGAASITNTATVTDAPSGGSASASDTDTRVPQVVLTAAKTDGAATYTAGATGTYVVTIGNAGASSALNVGVSDPLPAGVVLTGTATCVATAGSSCGAVTGATGATSVSASGALVAPGGTLTFTLPVRFASAMVAASITNTVTATDAASGGSASASDTDTRAAQVALAITKTDGATTYTPGAAATYTIVGTNAGPSDAHAVALNDALPSGVTLSAAATCVAAGNANCGTVSGTAGGASAGLTAGRIAAGAGNSLTLSVPVAFAPGLATDPLINVATATDPDDATPHSASDSDTLNAQTGLSLTKTDNGATYTPGGTATYVVTLTNGGPSDARVVSVTDALPAGVLLSGTVTCVPGGSASCATVTGNAGQSSFSVSGAVVPAGAGNQIVLSAPVTFAASLATSPLVNTATASDAPSGGTASASDSDTRAASVSLVLTKTDNSATYTPGGTATYTIVLTNAGLSDATGVSVSDALPAGVTLTASATCVAAGNASCGTVSGAAGQNAFGASGAAVGAGAGNSLTFVLPVRFASSLVADPLLNTVTASDASGALVSATDSDSITRNVVLAVTKTDGAATYTPGDNGTYTVVVTNTGTSDAADVGVADALPGGVLLRAAVTCVASGAASCGSVNGTAGQSTFSAASASIPAGSGQSLTFTVPVKFDSGLTTDPLVNTVTVADAPSGATAAASDSDARSAVVALALTKSDGSATYTPGGTAVYSVVVTNQGLSDALDVTVADALPAGVTLTASASCVATGNAACGTVTGAAGQTSFSATSARVGAAPGDALTFSVPVAFAPGLVTDPLVNTAIATDAPSGSNASASDSDARSVSVSLAVAKTDGSATYVPGGGATYAITVSNGGISDALDVAVTDALPFGVTLTGAATCVASGNAACGIVSGTAGQTALGTTGARVGAGSGNAIVLSAPVAFAAGLATDPLVNTATALDAPSGSAGSGSDSDARLAQVALAVGKTDGVATYAPGGTSTYVVRVTNTGASDALDVTVSDTLPNGVTLDAAVMCAASGNAGCGTVVGSAGQAAFSATSAHVGAGAGNVLTFTVPVRFASGLADDPVINTAVATDLASGASGSGSDRDARMAQVTLSVMKSDGSATYTPGGTATYTVVVGNSGPTDAADVTVTDALPAGVTLAGSVTCVATGSASCGTVSGTAGAASFGTAGASVPAGAAHTLTFAAPVAFAGGLTTDPLVNTVEVVDAASGATASASDSDARSASVSLAVAKTDGVTTYVPGGSATYTITVTNGGASDASAVTIDDVLPAGVTLTANATCVASGSSSCGTVSGSSGQTHVMATGARVAAGVGNAVVLTVPVSFAPNLTANPLVNTATAQDALSGASGSASDADALAASVTLTLTKTDNAATYVPGGTATYVIVVGNSGPSNANGVAVTDNLPAGVTLAASAICTPGGSASCGTLSGATGASAVTLAGAAIAAGAGNALTLSVPVRFDGALATDPLVNTVSATAQGASAVTASDSDARAAQSGLTLGKTDNRTTYVPGDNGTYVLTLGNNGPSDAAGVALADTLPPGVTLRVGATCVASGAATCGTLAGAVGGGTFTMSGGSVAAGAGNQLVVSVPVHYAPSLRANPLVNTATASAAGGATASATDRDTLDVHAGLALGKTDNAATYTPGGTATYVLHVTNAGPSDASGLAVTDTLPAGVTLTGAPTCVATGSATCGTLTGAVNGGAFSASGGSIAAGAGNALDYALPVRFASSLTTDPLTNIAQASADGGALAQASDTDGRTRVAPQPPAEIPLDDPRLLGLLGALLALAGARSLRRRRPRTTSHA